MRRKCFIVKLYEKKGLLWAKINLTVNFTLTHFCLQTKIEILQFPNGNSSFTWLGYICYRLHPFNYVILGLLFLFMLCVCYFLPRVCLIFALNTFSLKFSSAGTFKCIHPFFFFKLLFSRRLSVESACVCVFVWCLYESVKCVNVCACTRDLMRFGNDIFLF